MLRRSLVLYAFALFVVSSAVAGGREDALEAQRQAASPRTMFIPMYSIAGADTTELFFVSKITDPMAIDIFATAPNGEQLYLGQEVLVPSRSLSIPLQERLATAGEAFQSGSLRLDYTADKGALQVWAVMKSGRQTFEVPFVTSDKLAVNELYSYWDTSFMEPYRRATVEYRLTNTTSQPVPYTVVLPGEETKRKRLSGMLGALQSKTFVVAEGRAAHRGWLRVMHSGPAGAILGAGVIRSREPLVYLPLVPQGDLRRGPVHDLLRLPTDSSGQIASGTLTLFNTADRAQSVAVDVVRQSTGALVSSRQVRVGSWDVASVDLRKLTGQELHADLRLRIRGAEAGLVADGFTVTPAGEVLDWSVHPAVTAHKSGTYPIPDLGQYEVKTTIVNITGEPADIVAQYWWDGGSYTVPQFTVPPYGTAEIDPARLAAQNKPDILGRTLDPAGKNLALKWDVRRGARELIGRTEVRRLDGSDGWGFNCGGCCWSYPRGSINPQSVEVGENELVYFEAVVYFDTCSGPVGPYGSGMLSSYVPSPFSWDGMDISASDGAEEMISFEGREEQTTHLCIIEHGYYGGDGMADSCKQKNPNNYRTDRTCSQQTTGCISCQTCCDQLYEYKICKRHNPQIALSERNACIGVCVADWC